MNSYSCFKIRPVAEFCVIVSLTTVLTACARVSLTPESIRPPEPAAARRAVYVHADSFQPCIKTAQAFRPMVREMFEPQDHPVDAAYPGGPPVPPYDIAGWT